MYVRTRRHLPSSYPNRSQSLSLALSQDPQSIPIEFRKQSGLPFTSRSVNRVIDEYVALRERQKTQGRTSIHRLRQIMRVVKFWREYISDQSIESIGNKELSGYVRMVTRMYPWRELHESMTGSAGGAISLHPHLR